MRTIDKKPPFIPRHALPFLAGVTIGVAVLTSASADAWAQQASPPPPPPPGTTGNVVVTFGGTIPGVPLAYQGPDAVSIHLTNASNGGGTLFHESASGWEAVCAIPCTTTVDPKTDYKLHDSNPFRFPSESRSLDLVADFGSRRTLTQWGGPLVLLGITGMLVSPFLLLAPLQDAGHLDAKPLDPVVGWTTLGVSGAMVIAGIVLASINPPTTLTTTDGRRIGEEPSIPLPGHLALTTSGIAF